MNTNIQRNFDLRAKSLPRFGGLIVGGLISPHILHDFGQYFLASLVLVHSPYSAHLLQTRGSKSLQPGSNLGFSGTVKENENR